ncbi:MAG: type IV-A pilus assembly ATPase PilB, partial [Thermodesulfobacteriota bacterium]
MAVEQKTRKRKSSLKGTVKDRSGAGRVKVGELLSKAGYITPAQLATAKKEQKKNGGRLGAILRRFEYIEEDTVFTFLSRQHNFTPVQIKQEPPSSDAIKLVPYEFAKRFMALPLRVAGKTLQITMAEPTDTEAVEKLQEQVGRNLAVCVSTEKDLVEAFKTYYKIDDDEAASFFLAGDEVEEEMAVTEVDDFGSIVAEAADDFEIESGGDDDIVDQFAATDAPIIKLVNGILVKAVQDGVSDIHVEPYEKTMQVRYRKDGSLFKSMNLPLTI